MNFLLVLLLVVVIPPLLGGLLALFLREVHIHYPLPLGGAIVHPWEYAKRKAQLALLEKELLEKDLQEQESLAQQEKEEKEEEEDCHSLSEDASSPRQTIPLESLIGLNEAESPPIAAPPIDSEVSVFDDSKYSHLPISSEQKIVNTLLESMMAETPEKMSSLFEHRIEEAAQTHNKNVTAPQDDGDDMNDDDLQALSAALPSGKINFSQELDSSARIDSISPMAKELLGENFDFSLLEKTAKDESPLPASQQEVKQESDSSLKTEIAHSDELKTDKADAHEPAIDIQEDSEGNIYATGMFMISDSPQWAALTHPQTVLPVFLDAWIQEKDTDMGLPDSETATFCFQEESRPMFVRKRKNL